MKKLTYLIFSLVILTVSGCGYNTMQANEEAVKAAWGDVEAAYQRRTRPHTQSCRGCKGIRKA